MKWYVAIIHVFVQFIIVVIGGVIIYFIEKDNEVTQATAIIKKFNEFKNSKPCLTPSDITALQTVVQSLERSGLSFSADGNYGTSWDFQSGIYAALQVACTAGFGASSPKTPGGRVFVIFYALIGIPIFVVVALGLGQQMLKFSDMFRRKFWTAKYGDSWKVFIFRSVILLIIGYLIFSVIFGGIFCAIDRTLSYGEVLGVISIVFIGPGEFIPGGKNATMFKSWYRLLVGVWTFASVIWFGGVFSTIRRSILQRYANDVMETPDSLQEAKTDVKPLSSTVDISSSTFGPQKTTSLYSKPIDGFRTSISTGQWNSIDVN